MTKRSDIKLNSQIYVSRALWNNSEHRVRAESAARVISRALDVLKQHLDLRSDLTVRICSFRNSAVGGQYDDYSRTAEINLVVGGVHRTFRDMIVSLAHELVHCEQYQQGRLAWTGRNYQWNGKNISNRGSTYQSYRKLPWEIEAFNRQNSLADLVLEELNLPL